MFARQGSALGTPSSFHLCFGKLGSSASPFFLQVNDISLEGLTTEQLQLSLLSSCSCLRLSQSILLLKNLKDGSRVRTPLTQASKRNDKKGRSSKQPKTGHESSGKTRNPWVENISVSPQSKSSAKKKPNAWNENGKQVASSSKEKAVEKKNANGAISSIGDVFISGMMPTEEEELLQPYETVVSPLWSTFASSNAGIWQGIAAAFSPFSGELEPTISVSANKNVYDCKTWNISKLIRSPESSNTDMIHRKVLWNAESNIRGEIAAHSMVQENHQIVEVVDHNENDGPGMSTTDVLNSYLTPPEQLAEADAPLRHESREDESEFRWRKGFLADFRSHENCAGMAMNESGSVAFEEKDTFDVMDEDYLAHESGLVFFEDGSYSRGPLCLLEETTETSTMAEPLVFRIEQCLVRGGHTRLRVVHTIEVEEGGATIQVLRLMVFEEEWKGLSNWTNISATGATLPSFVQRKRLKPDELMGHWKVFEIDVSVIYEAGVKDGLAILKPSLQHFCKETQISRQVPTNTDVNSEGLLETDNNSVLWLLGGVYTYMDVSADGMLIIGSGWLGKDNTHLVMERLYDPAGNLAEVRSKSEIKVQ